ncbi:MAG: CHAT domain-containing protein [Bryobacteraceae bacterium]|nr:CHAT domain-containing protein [Bryobacteraceae bacterium]
MIEGRVLRALALTLAAMIANAESLPVNRKAPLTASLRKGLDQKWTIPLHKDDFVAIDVIQEHDVALRLLAPDSKELVAVDYFEDEQARERLFWIAKDDGTYFLEVKAGSQDSRITVTAAKRVPVPEDIARLEAQKLFVAVLPDLSGNAEAGVRASGVLSNIRTLARNANDTHLEMLAMAWRCLALRRSGNFAEQEKSGEELLRMGVREKDTLMASYGSYHRGIGSVETGRYSEGLDALRHSADISEANGRNLGAAMANSIIASLQNRIGVTDMAEDRARRALVVFERYGNQRGAAAVHLTMAGVRSLQRELPDAVQEYEAALAIYRQLKDPTNEAIVLRDIATIRGQQGRAAEGLVLATMANELSHKSGLKILRASTLRTLGRLQMQSGNSEGAITSVKAAIQMAVSEKLASAQASGHFELASILMLTGQLQEARQEIEQSLKVLEGLRQTIREESLRQANLSTQRGFFGLYIAILAELDKLHPADGYAALAFEASERSRARGLVELLQENKIQLDGDVPGDLLANEAKVEAELNRLTAEQTRLLLTPETAEAASRLGPAVAKQQEELDRMRGLISEKSPEYADIIRFRPVPVSKLQADLLDDNTALVEYFSSRSRTYIWVVTRSGIRLTFSDGLDAIQDSVQRAYASITARNDGASDKSAGARALRLQQASVTWAKESAKLSDALLKPWAAELGRAKRVIIVPDLPLHYVPFAALPVPSENITMASKVEVIVLPSASVAQAIREAKSLQTASPEDKQIAILADPVFTSDDSRLKGSPGRVQGNLTRSTANTRASFSLTRLPFTRREAMLAGSFVDPSSRFVALDFEASRELAMSGRLRDYRILHFATHSVLDNQYPDASGIVLSLVDKNGQYVDGVIRLHDLYRLKLKADLVVLSACQTALGSRLNSEGFVGVARGMLYAGASGVIASLWKVDDAATMEWMRLFYAAYLGRGMTVSAAVRSAQTEMARIPRWKSPYYWAAFTFIGDPLLRGAQNRGH